MAKCSELRLKCENPPQLFYSSRKEYRVWWYLGLNFHYYQTTMMIKLEHFMQRKLRQLLVSVEATCEHGVITFSRPLRGCTPARYRFHKHAYIRGDFLKGRQLQNGNLICHTYQTEVFKKRNVILTPT